MFNFYFVTKSGATKYGPGYIQMAAHCAAYFDFEINIKYISKIRSVVPSDEDDALKADCDHFD